MGAKPDILPPLTTVHYQTNGQTQGKGHQAIFLIFLSSAYSSTTTLLTYLIGNGSHEKA